jgi:hypothetical protein
VHLKRALVVALALAALAAGPATASADEAAWLFEPDRVAKIDFTLTPEARVALAAEPDEYVRASFAVERDDGVTFGPITVGLRLKGSTSFRTLDGKAAFKLKFNEFVKGQKFLGLKKLTLNNMVQDATMVREVLSYEAFRAVGLPSWRTGYTWVRVNGDAYGVYLNIETPDDVSLPSFYAETQHLYEGERDVDLDAAGLPLFEADEGDEDDRSDLAALVGAVDAWSGVASVADLEQMTRFWAVERYIGHWDGYSGWIPNNYYLHSEDTGVFTMLPWGTDQTWSARLYYGDPGGLMFDKCIADAVCRALYVKAVWEVTDVLDGLDLRGLLDDTAELLDPWLVSDPRRETTLAQRDAGLAEIRAFIDARPSDAVVYAPRPEEPREEEPPEEEPPPPSDEEGQLPEPDDVRAEPTPEPVLPPPTQHLDTADPPAVIPAPAAFVVRSVRLDRQLLVTTVDVPSGGLLSLWASARLGGEEQEICRARPRIAAAGSAVMRCRLTRAARRAVARGTLRARVRAGFRPQTGPATTDAHRVTLRLARR